MTDNIITCGNGLRPLTDEEKIRVLVHLNDPPNYEVGDPERIIFLKRNAIFCFDDPPFQNLNARLERFGTGVGHPPNERWMRWRLKVDRLFHCDHPPPTGSDEESGTD